MTTKTPTPKKAPAPSAAKETASPEDRFLDAVNALFEAGREYKAAVPGAKHIKTKAFEAMFAGAELYSITR